MKKIKNYLITLGSITLSLIIMLLILTTLYYFDIIKTSTYSLFKMSIIVLTIIINCIFLGRSSDKKGYLEGIKIGLILSSVCIIISLFQKSFEFKNLLYYLIIIVTSTLGSMIGMSTKKIDKASN